MTRYGLIFNTGIALMAGLALGTAIAQQGTARAAPHKKERLTRLFSLPLEY